MFGIVDRLGSAGVGLLILLENLVPPVPSEVVLPLAGFRASTGTLNLVTVWPAATAGSVVGALLLYGLGAWLGYDRLHDLSRRRWFVLFGRRDLERGKRLFDDHGSKLVLLGRMVPFVRSVVSVPAGVAGMPLGRFALLTAIGSGIWNALFLGLGWWLGQRWEIVEAWTGPVGVVVTMAALAGLGWLMVRRLRSPVPASER
ncbi:DedA family protein [Pseudonocardia sp.]|uniref:DedA family protein n=1 Tax=Pseudonocardia sp. TaxID=60912 RepID=UPI003D0C7F2C